MKHISTLCLLLLTTAAQAQWELTTAIKSRSKFPAVHMANAQRGYALDNVLDAILRTNDGGHTWERMTTLAINAPHGLYMWDGLRGIVVGTSGSIIRTDDGFSTFTSANSATLGSLRSVAFANDTLGLIGNTAGAIRRTTDGGATWTLAASGVGTSYTIVALAMPGVDTAFAIAYGVGVLRSTDGGLTWGSTDTPTGARAMHFSDAMNGLVVGNGGAILRTSDAGATWEEIPSGVTQNLLSMVVQGNVVLAAGTSGRVVRSTDGGATWTAAIVGTGLMVHQSIALGPEGVGFTGTDGRIFGTTDHGATWELIRPGTYHTFLNKISFANGDTGVAVGYQTSGGYDDGLLRTLDGGRTWLNANANGGLGVHLRPDGIGIQGGGVGANARTTNYFETRQNQPGPNVAIRCTWSFGEFDHLVAGGYVNGGFYRTANGGSTWQHFDTQNNSILDLYFINAQVGYAVGVGGQTYKSTDAGYTWEVLPNIMGNDQFSVFFLNEQVGWTVGANSGARTTDGGQTWTIMADIPGYSMMVHFVNADTGYVVGNSGHTLRSVDGGASWQFLLPGITNAVINDAAYVDGVLVLAGRFGDIYRAQVACPPVAEVPGVTQNGTTLCTNMPGVPQWYFNGEALPNGNTACIEALAPGQYHVVVTGGAGCASAPSVVIEVECPAIGAPVIMEVDGQLCANAEGDLQWYFNGEPLAGATSACIDATAPGAYHVVVTDEYGCASAPSVVYDVECDAIPAPAIEEVDGTLLCTAAEGDVQWYLNGEPLAGATTACIDATAPGAYHVVVTDAYGCASAPSDTVMVIHTQVGAIDGRADLRLAPNPATDHVRIMGLDGMPAWVAVTDVHGRTVRTQHLASGTPQVDVSGLAPGVYVLRIATALGESRLRMVRE